MSIGNIPSNASISYGKLYTNYPVRNIPQVDQTEAEEQLIQSQKQEAGILESSNRQPAAVDNRSRNADLENISLTFHPAGDGAAIGKDSDILSLDMQKAISDMKKDSILEEYQYFVGSSQEMKAEIAGLDGMVIQKL